MTNLDLSTWIDTTAQDLVAELPLQSLDAAVAQAYLYLSDVGGWVPDNNLLPTGPGVPANGFTPQQAADAITADAFASVYDIALDVVVNVRVHGIAKFTSGLSLDTAAASIAAQITEFLTTEINNSPIPVRLESTSTQTISTPNSSAGGIIDQSVRQNIQDSITNGNKIVDYKALTVVYLRNTYGLDITWNVFSVYTEVDTPINIIVRKYTDDTYSTLDLGDTRLYVINVSPTTYGVVTGAILG